MPFRDRGSNSLRDAIIDDSLNLPVHQKLLRDLFCLFATLRLAHDLGRAFPGMAGFSERNLRYMREFFQTYKDPNLATAVAKLPWGHNVVIRTRYPINNQQLWYVQQVLDYGWSG